ADARARSVAPPVLLLDDRGQDDELLRGLDRQVRRAPRPDLVQRLALRPLHAVDGLLAGLAPLALVGVGQERALARHLGDVAGEDVVVADALHDLLARQ